MVYNRGRVTATLNLGSRRICAVAGADPRPAHPTGEVVAAPASTRPGAEGKPGRMNRGEPNEDLPNKIVTVPW
jgi:hypothetical protein